MSLADNDLHEYKDGTKVHPASEVAVVIISPARAQVEVAEPTFGR